MDCEWDPRKAAANLRKHGVDFADAALVLDEDHAVTILDPRSDEEDRFITIGLDPYGRVLVVVFTWRGQHVRLISAREATRRERRQYEESR